MLHTHTPRPLCQEQNLREDFCHCHQRHLCTTCPDVTVKSTCPDSVPYCFVETSPELKRSQAQASKPKICLKKRDQVVQVNIKAPHCTQALSCRTMEQKPELPACKVLWQTFGRLLLLTVSVLTQRQHFLCITSETWICNE